MKYSINSFLTLLVLAASVAGCTKDNFDSPSIESQDKVAHIVNSSKGAEAGSIIVKFRSDASAQLDASGLSMMTRGGSAAPMSRSGIASTDVALDKISATTIERVFPVDARNEEMTRSASLHLWYVVRFDNSQDLDKVAKILAENENIAKVEFTHRIKRVSKSKVTPVEANSKVYTKADAAPSAAMSFDDPKFGDQWNLFNDGEMFGEMSKLGADINADAAWKKLYADGANVPSTSDTEIIVAVLDEGICLTHEDLAQNLWVNPLEELASNKDNDGNGYVGDRHGYNFVDDNKIITWNKGDDTGHGSHVAGIVAAVNNNGTGISSIAGGNGHKDSGVRLMSCQVFDGIAGVTAYDEARAIKYAADNGAVILQCSWGYNSGLATYPDQIGPFNDEIWLEAAPLEKEALDYFVNNAGSPSGVIDGGIAIFAGGNEAAGMVGYPGRYKDYISVTSIAADYTAASYTNYDKLAGVAAPGGDRDYYFGYINEAGENISKKGEILSTVPTHISASGYGAMEGTSMACPHVSGTVALGLSYAAKLKKHFKAEAFREMVYKATQPLPEESFAGEKTYYYYSADFGSTVAQLLKLEKYNGKMGHGLIDAEKLMNLVESDGNGAAMRLPNVTLSVGETRTIEISDFILDSASKSFSVAGADAAVAACSVQGTVITIKAEAAGITTLRVTANGFEQNIGITVRNNGNAII